MLLAGQGPLGLVPPGEIKSIHPSRNEVAGAVRKAGESQKQRTLKRKGSRNTKGTKSMITSYESCSHQVCSRFRHPRFQNGSSLQNSSHPHLQTTTLHLATSTPSTLGPAWAHLPLQVLFPQNPRSF
ncbi:hypothetical protein N658DRAFT_47312 [Parathielavia hyrcaniae]|uniref:Uncharacterized protein n=1 Tax=Parathielavia hyrcaniae TaxID=113614 RepID=A0AAN6PQQ3_9PEZI|nr:hypothetical protein N658DRAFT_47312 [Parathielavia hyrcaniae]